MKKGLKNSWMKMPAIAFVTLTFAELEVGDKFICLPTPGDNDGHGGFRGLQYIYVKTQKVVADTGGRKPLPYHEDYPHGQARKTRIRTTTDFPHSMPVIQIG